ncbi:hypothetical protein GLOTRDRAFT_122008 [Gloeophyllum trabeum ATCC 11539]|uniref:Zn(2)-C6 fungal-type domain-containing protein n=1 Tax=Gloeophyllum trabeum (strain ATCC 11539 / FP-39264 / Madison 617) TaxID=670483 RepID=S7RN77_GLOTA|nr:uncharacterized protein GLOTRDRAFT_122008 [Gloeophyllum trabeum ATCC 11539]EPQ54209.1 hypothetical protein GLOTRDRAFT_122008 [Gloeophyllum trabeum ATCC 11539]
MYSDIGDRDHWPPLDGTYQADPGGRKRASRACDQCRKTKSKCELLVEGGPCRNCAESNLVCTFLGPTYKRGPPKGYLHAIEQRWYQAETILGAILASPDPRAREIISALQKDDLAREVLNRVDIGPFGPTGRASQPAGATMEDLFHSFIATNERQTQRQSRVSREIVSTSKDSRLSPSQAAAWQDRLTTLLGAPPTNPPSSDISQHSSPPDNWRDGHSSEREGNRRPRLGSSPDFSGMYTIDGSSDATGEHSDDVEESSHAIGQLSLDENDEVRFHGEASGLHLLGQSERTDDRKEDGIWKLPMARVWPHAPHGILRYPEEDSVHVAWPPIPEQDRLVEMYFTYFHPSFPVLDQKLFMEAYEMSKEEPSPSSAAGSQKLSKLLLCSIFSIAERYCIDDGHTISKGEMHEEGCQYLDWAREILNRVYHHSRLSTCQALLLLGIREFGIGSVEHGWLYIGMASHMAQDLGLHRALDNWQYQGKELFSAEDTQIRRQVWWCCNIADKYVSVYMGRPVCIKEADFDTPLPDVRPDDENEHTIWQPYPLQPQRESSYIPVQTHLRSCFRAMSSLALIIGNIVDKIYPIRSKTMQVRVTESARLEQSLSQWYLNLPNCLQYNSSNATSPTPPPHVLVLHMMYWSTVLLLHRAFFPRNAKDDDAKLRQTPDAVIERARQECKGAANHVSSIAVAYGAAFGLRYTTPFLTSYILGAGIMHIVTLSTNASDVQASLGLRQCLESLKEMGDAWPSAARAWELLNGVKVQFEGSLTPLVNAPVRQKRRAEDEPTNQEYVSVVKQEPLEYNSPNNNYQGFDSRTMAQMLGLEVSEPHLQDPGFQGNTSWPFTIHSPSSQPWAALSHLDFADWNLNRPTDGVMAQQSEGNDWLPDVGSEQFPYDPYRQYPPS